MKYILPILFIIILFACSKNIDEYNAQRNSPTGPPPGWVAEDSNERTIIYRVDTCGFNEPVIIQLSDTFFDWPGHFTNLSIITFSEVATLDDTYIFQHACIDSADMDVRKGVFIRRRPGYYYLKAKSGNTEWNSEVYINGIIDSLTDQCNSIQLRCDGMLTGDMYMHANDYGSVYYKQVKGVACNPTGPVKITLSKDGNSYSTTIKIKERHDSDSVVCCGHSEYGAYFTLPKGVYKEHIEELKAPHRVWDRDRHLIYESFSTAYWCQ